MVKDVRELTPEEREQFKKLYTQYFLENVIEPKEVLKVQRARAFAEKYIRHMEYGYYLGLGYFDQDDINGLIVGELGDGNTASIIHTQYKFGMGEEKSFEVLNQLFYTAIEKFKSYGRTEIDYDEEIFGGVDYNYRGKQL